MSFHALNRRTFLKTAGTAATVSLLPSQFLWAASQHKVSPIGVQLYTVRDLMKNDFEGTIAQVGTIHNANTTQKYTPYSISSPRFIPAKTSRRRLCTPLVVPSRTICTHAGARPEESVPAR